MTILPYMYQLPLDYVRSKITPTTPAEAPPSYLYRPPPVSQEDSPGTPAYQLGGAYVGTSPPANPDYGWLWLNSTNNGLYVYGDPGVWTQVGTNW